jgi:predicted double-glycine peptidase
MNVCRLRLFLLSVVAAALGLGATTAFADDLRLVAPLGGNLTVPTVSLKEARFVATLRQQYDFSCGSAAVATLLTHHYGWKVEESTVFQAMFEHGNRDKIRREGFSMLDMKRYMDSRGFATDGVEATLDELAKAKLPAIVLIKENGYAHFVVIKGVRPGQVVIGDPAMGTRVLARKDFERVWMNNILLVVTNRTDQARFNRAEDWRVRPRAPLGADHDNAIAGIRNTSKPSLLDF